MVINVQVITRSTCKFKQFIIIILLKIERIIKMFSKLVYLTTASLVHGQDEFDFGAEVTAFEDGDFNFDDFNPDDFENFAEADF